MVVADEHRIYHNVQMEYEHNSQKPLGIILGVILENTRRFLTKHNHSSLYLLIPFNN